MTATTSRTRRPRTPLDQLEGRCEHDMLCWPALNITTCSVCKGLPWDVPLAPEVLAELEDYEPEKVRWYTVSGREDRRVTCVACETTVAPSERFAWSSLHGVLCEDCAGAAA